MSVASDLINQFKAEGAAPAETSTETVTETPAEIPESVANNQPEPEKEPESEPEKGPEKEPEKDTPEPEKEEPKSEPKPDLSTLSKEEKASHAFQKQLAKQKAKYENTIEDLKKSFQSQFDDLKKSLAPKPEPEPMKTRDDFENDTDFVNYLAMRGVDQRLAEKAEADAKAKAEADAKAKEEAELEQYKTELLDNFDKNAKATFGENSAAFDAKLSKAQANGLGEVLREAPAVRDFIFTHPDGPLLLNEILDSKEAFVRVFSRSRNPEDARWICNEVAAEVRNKSKVVDNQPAIAPKVMPNLGKPGAGAAPSTAPDMWRDDRSLIDFVRQHR